MKKIEFPLVERLAIRYGILMTLALIGFFMLMTAFGLEHHLELRAFNIFILFSFVLMAVKAYRRRRNYRTPYFSGLGVGVLTTIIGTVLFAMFVLLYLTVISPEFMAQIKSQEPFGDFLTPLLVVLTIIIEGTASGILVSYALMQYFRPDHLVTSSEIFNN